LVDKLDKSVNVVGHRGGLADVTELAKDEFMLIMIEMLMDQSTEARLVEVLEQVFNGLEPTARSPFELHSGAANPNTGIHEIHLEVGLGLSDPELGIFTIEGWEIELG
jgi:hypothetical protein